MRGIRGISPFRATHSTGTLNSGILIIVKEIEKRSDKPSKMLDQITKLIRVTTGIILDKGSNLLTRGDEHDVERKLLYGGVSETNPVTISVYDQASPMLNSK